MVKKLSVGLGIATILAFALLTAFMFAPSVFAATNLFTDNFDQSGGNIGENNWATFSGANTATRDDTSDDGFTVGASSKGILMEGNSGSNPDEGAEHEFATQGFSSLNVSYSRAISGFEVGDEFVAQYSLDDGPFVNIETLTANQTHSVKSATIPNPDRHTKLTVRFFVNGVDETDEAGVDNFELTGDNAPLYYDGFESNDYAGGNWTTEESPIIAQSANFFWTNNNTAAVGHAANIDGVSTANPDDAIYTTIDSTGYEDLMLRFARRVDNLGTGENLKAYVSTDGSSWTELASFDNVAFGSVSYVLPAAADNNSNVRIRFEVNGNSAGDDAYVDDVVVWGAQIQAPTDVCPNVPGDQASGPCADQECVNNGGTWNGTSCDMPPTTGTLIVQKTITNDNGGLSDADDFSFTVEGGSSIAFEADGENQMVVNAGQYTIVEDAESGYAASYLNSENSNTNCDDLTVPAGGSVTCTITNNDIAPSLTLDKVVINDSGNDEPESEWTLQALGINGSIAGPGAAGSTDVVSGPTFKAGTYSLSEVGPSGYTASAWSCVGGSQNGSEITLMLGEIAVCTITNDDNAAPPAGDVTVTIHKYIDGVHASDANSEAQSFPMQSSWANTGFGDGSGNFSLATPTYDAQTSPMDQGASYSTNELTTGSSVGAACADGKPFALQGYTWAETEAGAAALAPDSQSPAFTNLQNNMHVIVWNVDCTPKLKVTKVVTNDNNGTAEVSDFILSVGDGSSTTTVTSGAINTFAAGNYTVEESGPSGYTATFSGACDGNPNVSLAAGDSKECTITNDDNPPAPVDVKVTIVKYVGGVHATSGNANSAAFPMQSSWNAVNLGGAGSGTYTLSPAGFNTPNAYEAVTSDMDAGSDYATNEDTSGSVVGANCASGQQFRLSGYTSGTSLVAAEGASVSSTSPAFTNLQNDQWIIVWNEPCPPPAPEPPAGACATPLVAPAGFALQNGTAGSDTVTIAPSTMFVGKNGNDKVTGSGPGNYIVCTGAGNDTITLPSGNYTIDAGSGNNIIQTGDGNGPITSGAGNDKITVGNGDHTINAGAANNEVITGNGTQNVTTGPGADKVTTGSGNDTINAGAGNNTIKSGAGADTITTAAGNDSIDGGADTDSCSAGSGMNTVTNCP